MKSFVLASVGVLIADLGCGSSATTEPTLGHPVRWDCSCVSGQGRELGKLQDAVTCSDTDPLDKDARGEVCYTDRIAATYFDVPQDRNVKCACEPTSKPCSTACFRINTGGL